MNIITLGRLPLIPSILTF